MSGGGTPRQQMIGLMYLVLLAMLAMNASKSLLDAFVMLEVGIDKTVSNFTVKNNKYYEVIDAAAAKGIGKDKQKTAQEIKAKADEISDIIAHDKKWLLTEKDDPTDAELAEKYDEHGIPLNKDNQDLGAQYYMVNEKGANGKKLEEAIDAFRELVIKKIDTDGIPENDFLKGKWEKVLATDPDTVDGAIHSWVSHISEHLPLAAVTANLSLWQSYVRNAEADVVGSLAATLEGKGIVVNTVEGMATFESGYVLKGDTLKSSIFISAYNSNIKPVVYIGIPDTNKMKGGSFLDPTSKAKPPIIGTATPVSVSGGKGNFVMPADVVGADILSGVIGIPSTKGIEYFKFSQNYMIAEPTATIAATAMNVFYVGVNNPVSISAPGVSLDEIEVKGGGVSFRAGKKPGEYIARASKPNGKGTMINVVKKDGTKLGGMKFRIKRLPDPAASILNQKEGLVSRGKLKAATFIKAEMENFDFDVKVSVQQFKMTVSKGGDLTELNTKGNKLSGAMRKLLSSVRTGDRVYIEDIKVKLPDGTTRKVPSIILKVK